MINSIAFPNSNFFPVILYGSFASKIDLRSSPTEDNASNYVTAPSLGVINNTIIYKDIRDSEAYCVMLASEDILAKDWNTQDEDEAWAHL